ESERQHSRRKGIRVHLKQLDGCAWQRFILWLLPDRIDLRYAGLDFKVFSSQLPSYLHFFCEDSLLLNAQVFIHTVALGTWIACLPGRQFPTTFRTVDCRHSLPQARLRQRGSFSRGEEDARVTIPRCAVR